MIRNQLNWDEYWRWETREERTAGVYYDANDEPQGYVLYWIADEVFHVKKNDLHQPRSPSRLMELYKCSFFNGDAR